MQERPDFENFNLPNKKLQVFLRKAISYKDMFSNFYTAVIISNVIGMCFYKDDLDK